MMNTAAIPPVPKLVQEFLTELRTLNFSGECASSFAERLVGALDNSIYQILPSACLYPRNNTDIDIVMRLINEARYRSLSITAKGGATGTNGQSLTHGIVLDLSRHMNNILEFDASHQTVTVQAGVVKDQLNAFLKPHGFFFAPELSTSNRATIGGMISTDASGQGSYTYGKTRHHVMGLKNILLGGQYLNTHSVAATTFEAAYDLNPNDYQNTLYKAVNDLLLPHKKTINTIFPKLNRSVTGYDLLHYVNDDHYNLNHLLCGSEGTLGIIAEATLKVLPIPKFTALIILSYDDFIAALRDATFLMQAPVTPTSIEILDNRVVELAQNDYIWASTQAYFDDIDYTKLKALQLVEFNSDDAAELQGFIAAFKAYCAKSANDHLLSIREVLGIASVTKIYGLRKRAVGLLGNIKGERRPLPFVEDTAVPPENLADYIVEFRALLDQHQLTYGMFGHVDAGVLHVRPALDLKTDQDQALIRNISDAVFQLCQKYGGVLWGEHGKGVRSEYAPTFFGELYPVIQSVKSIFDPHNQLNPGKIATANNGLSLSKIDALPMRGSFDRQITKQLWQDYQPIVFCNGNGACFNYDLNASMCPSYKATRDRMQSPKGRATLLKEWLRQKSHNEIDALFEREVFQSLETCLSCQSCTGECPVKVNIPDAKAKFMAHYYQHNKRPLRDHLLSLSESHAPFLYKVRRLYAPLAQLTLNKRLVEKMGLVDTPLPKSHDLKALMVAGLVTKIRSEDIANLLTLSPEEKAHTVIIIPDAFNQFFDGVTLAAAIQLFARLKVKVYLAPYFNSGKAYHVLGMLDKFKQAATRHSTFLEALAKTEIALVGIEPPVTLMYRSEYPKYLGLNTPEVQLLQEWLQGFIRTYPESIPKAAVAKTYRLLSHCTEKTNAPNAPKLWQEIFTAFGHELTLATTGCCGMSGMFGHLAEHKTLSQTIYEQSWKPVIDSTDETAILLATGYSCRTQVERFSAVTLRHPIGGLLEDALAPD